MLHENQNFMNNGDQGGFARTGGSSQVDHFSPPGRDMEKNHQLKVANAEIMELKEGLRYAEFALAKTMREKEAVEVSKKQ